MVEREPMTLVFRRYIVATLAVVTVLVVCYAMYQIRIVALLFAIAGMLAYFLAWPITQLSKKVSRRAAVWIVFPAFFVVVLGLVGSIIPLVYGEIQDLVTRVPDMLNKLESTVLNWRFQVMPGREIVMADHFTNALDDVEQRIPQILGSALDITQSVVSSTASVIAAVLIIPLMTLYLLIDSSRLRDAMIGCFSKRWQPDVDRALTAVNKSLGGYIYSRVLLALFVGILTTIILLVLGIDYALLLGLLAFAGEFIPVLGPWLAFAPTAVIVLATNPYMLIWVVILYIAIQIIENYVLAPRWMGDTMDLHPLTVILAMMIGGTLGGIAGLFVAVPAAAAVKVIMGVFVFRRVEPGIDVPKLDLISSMGGNADIQDNKQPD
jgi:predicted PurR-regulated permease PerM